MKSRLPARRERATVARRMGATLHEMARENAASDETVWGAIDRLLAGLVVAGGSTVWVLWQGAAFTLGHLLVLLAGGGAAVGLWWRRRESRARPS